MLEALVARKKTLGGGVIVPPPSGDRTVPDYTRVPAAQSSPTVINISSAQTISGTVTNTTYNVTGAIGGSALNLQPGAVLDRVKVLCNGLVSGNGIVGFGAIARDCQVERAGYAGFAGGLNFEGCCLTERCYIGFYISGSSMTLPANAMIRSNNTDNHGILFQGAANLTLLGVLCATSGGVTVGNGAATAVSFWDTNQNISIEWIVSKAMPGYGAVWAGGATQCNVTNAWADATGASDGDPAWSFQGGAHHNTIGWAYAYAHSVGIIFGEDVPPQSHDNAILEAHLERAGYAAILIDRGAYANSVGTVGGTKIVDCGTVGYPDTAAGAVHFGNRGDQGVGEPHDNVVAGIDQLYTGAGAVFIPRHAVYGKAGTANNSAIGKATSWSVSKVSDSGTGNVIAV